MAAPRGYKQCRPNPVSGVHVNRSRPLAPRTRALVHGLCSPLDEVYRQLRRKPHQGAVLAALVVAEAQLSVAAPTEKDQTIAVPAEGHEWSGDSRFMVMRIAWRRIGQPIVVRRCPRIGFAVRNSHRSEPIHSRDASVNPVEAGTISRPCCSLSSGWLGVSGWLSDDSSGKKNPDFSSCPPSSF